MDRKVLYGLAALAAAVLLTGRSRRRVSGLGGLGLGSSTEQHVAEMARVTEETEHAIADAEWHVAQAIGATKGKAIGSDGKPTRLSPAYSKYHLSARCEQTAGHINRAYLSLGRVRAESMAAGSRSSFRDLWDDLHKLSEQQHSICHVQKPSGRELGFGGLGLLDPEHGMKRVYHSVQAGFAQKDAVRFARRGWCDQAFKALRIGEYETGQASGHAKSVMGPLQASQSAKGKAGRLAASKAADTVKKYCAAHKKRAPRVRGQGDLPF